MGWCFAAISSMALLVYALRCEILLLLDVAQAESGYTIDYDSTR